MLAEATGVSLRHTHAVLQSLAKKEILTVSSRRGGGTRCGLPDRKPALPAHGDRPPGPEPKRLPVAPAPQPPPVPVAPAAPLKPEPPRPPDTEAVCRKLIARLFQEPDSQLLEDLRCEAGNWERMRTVLEEMLRHGEAVEAGLKGIFVHLFSRRCGELPKKPGHDK